MSHINSGYVGVDKRSSKGGVYGLRKHRQERSLGNFKSIIHTPSSFSNQYSASLDGTNDYVGIEGLAGRSLGALSMWVNITSSNGIHSNSALGMLAGFGKDNTGLAAYDGLNWGYGVNTTDLLTLRNNGAVIAQYQVPSAGDKLAAGWHHIVLTHNGTGYTFYINGVIATSATLSDGSSGGSITTSTHSILTGSTFETLTNQSPQIRIKIGGNRNNNFYSQGLFDEVALFDSALSASNITTIYNSGVPGDLTSLSPNGWWRMGDNDGGSGTTITDQGSGENDATLTNVASMSSSVPS